MSDTPVARGPKVPQAAALLSVVSGEVPAMQHALDEVRDSLLALSRGDYDAGDITTRTLANDIEELSRVCGALSRAVHSLNFHVMKAQS